MPSTARAANRMAGLGAIASTRLVPASVAPPSSRKARMPKRARPRPATKPNSAPPTSSSEISSAISGSDRWKLSRRIGAMAEILASCAAARIPTSQSVMIRGQGVRMPPC